MYNKTIHNVGWKFDNSYMRLPESFYTKEEPAPVEKPSVVVINHQLAKELGLSLEGLSHEELANLFSGNTLPDSSTPIAQAYAGHQFGHFTMLGDGRAHLLGEHITPERKRIDIQFKGSGRTAYSRRGDGRAALGPMLREYIISEAMYALKVPTTRSLAVVTTGESVYRETELQGSILTRTAASHLRVGTFEYVASQRDVNGIRQLADYTIKRHYVDLITSNTPYSSFLEAVMVEQISLIVHWLRIGFIHGVMNTDNMTISGETIDYGPCAFMDIYDPQTVFSSIDQMGRYAYANQPSIAQWNLVRFAETLLPLLHKDLKQAATIAEKIIYSFSERFQKEWLSMMRSKLGLFGERQEDEALISDFLKWMQRNELDYTNSFRDIISRDIPEGKAYETKEFLDWWQRWKTRLERNQKLLKSSFCLMRANNPAIIPRNHKVEEALNAAEEHSDFSVINDLLAALKDPYADINENSEYRFPPNPNQRVYQTFCGT